MWVIKQLVSDKSQVTAKYCLNFENDISKTVKIGFLEHYGWYYGSIHH